MRSKWLLVLATSVPAMVVEKLDESVVGCVRNYCCPQGLAVCRLDGKYDAEQEHLQWRTIPRERRANDCRRVAGFISTLVELNLQGGACGVGADLHDDDRED